VTGGDAQEHAVVPCAASSDMGERQLRCLFLDKVLTYGGGAMWRTQLVSSQVAASTRTWHATVVGLTWASGASGEWSGGLLVMR
jgi:hypothetical protein